MPGKKSKVLEKVAGRGSSMLMYVVMGMLLLMMFLGSADVIGRYFFSKPIVGTFEIFEILLPGIVLLGLAYTQFVNGHVTMDIVYSRFPPQLRARIGFVTSLLLLCLFSLMAWRGTVAVITYWQQNRLVRNLHVPFFPFPLFVPLGALAMCLVLIAQMLQFLSEMRKKG